MAGCADRLVGFRRGTLSNDGNSIASAAKGAQEWNLDAVGNWRTFKDDATDGTSWDIDQSRTHNAVNELVTLTGSGASDWLDPNHDAAGNMTSGPSGGAWEQSVARATRCSRKGMAV